MTDEMTLRPIGVLSTPWRTIKDCPRNGRQPDPAHQQPDRLAAAGRTAEEDLALAQAHECLLARTRSQRAVPQAQVSDKRQHALDRLDLSASRPAHCSL